MAFIAHRCEESNSELAPPWQEKSQLHLKFCAAQDDEENNLI